MNEIERKDKEYVWHPFTQMKDWVEQPQLVITEADGLYLIDHEGKRYFDGVSSLWVNLHGHRKAALDQAIIDQLGKVAHTTMLGLINVPAAELAERLMAVVPQGLRKVFYSDDGSTAVEIAIKMAYQYWQMQGKSEKRTFLTLSNAYHGDTVGTVSIGGIDLFHRIFSSLLFKSRHAPSPCCYHCQLADDPATCGMACAAALERQLAEHHHEIAAVVVEPLIQAAAGMLTQPPGYLRRIREATEKYGVLLIVDEVATGFGRTGKMFACDHEDVCPDFMLVSKGITGGYLPLAATFVTEAIYQAFLGDYQDQKTFFHGHSYTGNPLACAAALANLRIFAEERLLETLPAKVASAKRELDGFWELPEVGDIRQCGLMIGIELVADKATKTPFAWELAVGVRVCRRARELGLMIRPLGNVVVFMPPLASSEADITAMLAIIKQAIQEVGREVRAGEGAADTAILI